MTFGKGSVMGPYSAEGAIEEGQCGGFVCKWRSGGASAETEGGWTLGVRNRVEEFEIMRVVMRIMIPRK